VSGSAVNFDNVWSEVTLVWSEVTFGWGEMTMGRNDRIPPQAFSLGMTERIMETRPNQNGVQMCLHVH